MKLFKKILLLIIPLTSIFLIGHSTIFPIHAEQSEITDVYIETDGRLKTPVKVLIIGDSLIEWGFGSQLENKLNHIEGVIATKRFKISSGLNRKDYFNWFTYTQDIINDENPDVLIIYLGANDGQNIIAEDGRAYTMENKENWDAVYKKRVNDFLTNYHSQVKYIFWVGHPIPETPRFYNYFIRMNPIYEEQCAMFSNCVFINSWDRFAINGQFVQLLADNNGNIDKVKSKDGVHLTLHGGTILADLVIEYMSQKIAFGEIKQINQYPLEIIPDPNSLAPISYSTLPDIFLSDSSETTTLSNLTLTKASSVSDFTIEIKENGKIRFIEPVDLSNRELLYRFNRLDQYVKIENGKVKIDIEFLPQLDKKAIVKLYNIKLLQKPEIISSDGLSVIDQNKILLNDNVLTFETDGFSSYMVKPQFNFKLPPKSHENDFFTLRGHTSDLSAQIKIYSEEVEINTEVTIDKHGNFSTQIPLQNKENNYRLVVTFFNNLQEESTFTINKTGILPPNNNLKIIYVIAIIFPLFTISFLLILKNFEKNTDQRLK